MKMKKNIYQILLDRLRNKIHGDKIHILLERGKLRRKQLYP